MSPLRIVLLSSAYPSAAQPVNGIFVQDQAECLATRHHVTVLVPASRTEAPGRLQETRHQDVTCWHLPRAFAQSAAHSLHHGPVRALQTPLLRHALMCRAAYARGLAQYIRRHGKPHLLHAHNLYPSGWAAAWLGRAFGVKVAVTEHSSVFAQQMQQPLQQQLAQQALKDIHALLAVSPAMAETITRNLPQTAPRVLPNVIRTAQFVPAAVQPHPRLRFFCLCLHTPGKGLQYLIEAARLLLAQGQDGFELIIGGDGAYRGELEQLAKPLGAQCRFVGLLSRGQAVAHMQQCDVFVLPSLGETFGIVLGEAMACGKPVLTTRCGGPEYIVEEKTGLLLPPADAPALAAAMANLLQGRGDFDAVHIRATVCQRFGEAAFLQRSEALYNELIAE